MNGIKAEAQLPVKQDVGLVLENIKLKRFGQLHDEVLMTSTWDSRRIHYKANEDHIILKDGLLFPKYYGKTNSGKKYQVITPKRAFLEVVQNLHGEFKRHPGITWTVMAYGQIYYNPNMAQSLRR